MELHDIVVLVGFILLIYFTAGSDVPQEYVDAETLKGVADEDRAFTEGNWQFASAALTSTVVLTVADGNSDAVAKSVGAAVSGGFKNEVITIADDAAGVYCDGLISACSTITSKDVSTEFPGASVAKMFIVVIPSPTSVKVNTPSFSITVTTDGSEFVMT